MNGQRISKKEIETIISLRKRGYSLPEIRKITGRGNSTVFRYIQKITILPQYVDEWKIKQGGSRKRSKKAWEEARSEAERLVDLPIDKKINAIIGACLYWAEGSKKDLSLSNTDPNLIKIFLTCLKNIGVTKKVLKISIRIYEDIDRTQAIKYWAKVVGITPKEIISVNTLKGKKKGKLKYGMCRVRVKKGGNYFKLIQSVIGLIIESLRSPYSSMERTAHS